MARLADEARNQRVGLRPSRVFDMRDVQIENLHGQLADDGVRDAVVS